MSHTVETELDEVMIRDIFPAEVLVNDGRFFAKVRVFMTTRRIVVWKETAERTMEVAFEMSHTEHTAVVSRGTFQPGESFTATNGTVTATVNKGRGCGCGSKLKALPQPATWTRRR